jgi:putative ABC transport system permease protein
MSVNVFAKLAWRNVKRNKRRSALTVLIAAIGLATLIISNALYDGFHERMISNAVKIFMGHVQVHARGFQDNPGVEKCFVSPPAEVFSSKKEVAAFARRVRVQALASSAYNSQPVMVVGIEPERERQVTNVERSIVSGTYLKDSPENGQECLVGEQLLPALRIAPGEKLVLMTQAFDGSIATDAFRIAGVCRTGHPEIDRNTVWIPIKSAQRFLVYGDKISEIVILAKSAGKAEALKRSLSRELDQNTLEVLSWREIAPDIVQLVELDIAMQRVLMIIIAAIVAAAIMNTMLMAIQERFTELGVIAAIGTRPDQIIGMLLAESFFLGLLGLAAGAVLTGAGLVYFYLHGVHLASFSAGVVKLIGLDTTVHPVVKAGQVLISGLVVLVSSTVVSLIPAFRAAHLEPVKAIRHI